ncbi:hypothetical protein RBG61_09405 [Paludicola sp. MB14-C6]|uniref:hypothetical protein n=1 Tax=Paludihabitans sp. MB14-C6 TaxID=3070656 RepID=UPI0027DE8B64|nr:hypothetical protein [Paludicola sp. MB14-C6]WMJ22212.1 hypothetical protein RBG61_09405 [Paludicola sp. MB14-C6]
MNKIKISIKLIVVSLSILFLLGFILWILLVPIDYSKNNNPYPVLAYPASIQVIGPLNINQMCSAADDVFLGTVISSSGKITESYIVDKSIAEKKKDELLGIKDSVREVKYYSYTIRVDKVLKGELTKGHEIQFCRNSMYEDCSPKLTVDEQLLFIASYNSELNECIPFSIHSSYFYITKDNKVYPADHNEIYKKYNRMPLWKFEREVKSNIK